MTKFYVNADPLYTPKISISPFSLNGIQPQKHFYTSSPLEVLGSELLYTSSGKEAIHWALESLKLTRDDTVGIFTTSGNSYVSKCVTDTISQFCNWEIGGDYTGKACLFLIHEFGTLINYQSMTNYRSTGIPIINDFAYSFLSLYSSGRKDFHKEINITSLPKCFNINFGGILSQAKTPYRLENIEMKSWILEEISPFLNDESLNRNIEKRKANREYYSSILGPIGFDIIWNEQDIIPGVCMISPRQQLNLHELKIFLQRNGIESSVFYGHNSFFVPVHQNMTKAELDYVCFMIGSFSYVN